jgi:hypothetical protein
MKNLKINITIDINLGIVELRLYRENQKDPDQSPLIFLTILQL